MLTTSHYLCASSLLYLAGHAIAIATFVHLFYFPSHSFPISCRVFFRQESADGHFSRLPPIRRPLIQQVANPLAKCLPIGFYCLSFLD
uniref:Putative secreted protein n=1 Tax=Anopheles darlingi TaxID=43151 RepID=A0A2M4DEY7_ANODA